MSKNNDVNLLSRLAFRHHEPPAKNLAKDSVFQTCLIILLKNFIASLLMGAPIFLWSLFYTGDRADNLRWMSLAPMGGLMLGGIAQVISAVEQSGIDRRRNRSEKPDNLSVITDFSKPNAVDEAED